MLSPVESDRRNRGLSAPAVIGRHKVVELTPRQQVGRLLRLWGAADGRGDRAKKLAELDTWDDGNRAWQSRALVAGIGASGGFMVPEEYYPEIIDLLRNRAVVRKLGAVQLPMDRGNLTMPRLQTGATPAYVGEAVPQNATQEGFGQVRFTAHKMLALVPVSNDLLKFASPQADEIVLNDMIAQIAVAEDAAFIRGNGTQFTPKGLRNWAVSGNVLTSAGTGLTNFVTDLAAMEAALETNNVRMITPGIILNPRSKNAIKLLQATTGLFVFRDEMIGGTLDGYPFAFTNNIPANLGGGSQTEWYLADFADAVIADVPGLEIEISREAAYVDSTGTMQAAYSQDVTVLRAVEQHDFAMRHDVSVAVMTQVNY
jgi:HK97 family phage major capsid protein